MRVEVFDSIEPARTVFFDRGEQQLAAIIDGTGSWGNGREAADLARAALSELWSRSDWSLTTIGNEVAAATKQIPVDLRDDVFGWSFSVTVLLCSDNFVEAAAGGFYRVDMVGQHGLKNLFRPTMLVDELLAKGTLTSETAETFPHRHVCLGPFVGDSKQVPLALVRQTLLPGDAILVTHAARHNAALVADAQRPSSAAALAALAAPASYPSPVIFVAGS